MISGSKCRHLNSAVRDLINDSFCKHPLPKTQAGHPEPRFDQLKVAEAGPAFLVSAGTDSNRR
jgi:hypothetical protein